MFNNTSLDSLPVLVVETVGLCLSFLFSYPDIVVYLLYTTSFALEEVKNYKSLQSFKYFTSGWVLEIEWNEYPTDSIVLFLGKVRQLCSKQGSTSAMGIGSLQWNHCRRPLHLYGRASRNLFACRGYPSLPSEG